MTEEQLQKMVREHPDDAASWLVYADWLEQAGFSQRAEVVRLSRALAEATKHADRLAAARAVLDKAKGLKRAWLAVLNSRPIEGTTWGARDADDGIYVIGFGNKGVLHFMQGDPGDEPDQKPTTEGDGTWMQISYAVTFSIKHFKSANADFSRQDGVITGGAIRGIGSDADNKTWTWKLAQIDFDLASADGLPDLPAKPKDKEVTDGILLPRRRWK